MRDLTLPAELRQLLKDPWGPVVTGFPADLADQGPLFSVGDVVTADLIAAGQILAVAVIDGHTERGKEAPPVDLSAFSKVYMVHSDPGMLSGDLQQALVLAVKAKAPVLIRVDGEEDLAAVWLLANVPEGATVIYGQPGCGAVLARADLQLQKKSRDLLAAMTA